MVCTTTIFTTCTCTLSLLGFVAADLHVPVTALSMQGPAKSEKRLLKKNEEAIEAIFEEIFEHNVVPEEQCIAWKSFMSNLDATAYNTIEISGSQGVAGAAKCISRDAVTKIAMSMKQGVALQEPILCNGRKWILDVCSTIPIEVGGTSTCREGLALASVPEAGTLYNACACHFGEDSYVIRPGLGTKSFGGIGKTCNAKSQTLKVEFSNTNGEENVANEDKDDDDDKKNEKKKKKEEKKDGDKKKDENDFQEAESTAVVFEEIFGGITFEDQCNEWGSFAAQLSDTTAFNTVSISGSNGGGIATCTSPDVVNQIASSMNQGTSLEEPILCDGLMWSINICLTAPINEGDVNTCRNGLTLAAVPASKSFYNACACDFNGDADVFVVRPGIGSTSFGGIGKTCNAKSQTLRVEFG